MQEDQISLESFRKNIIERWKKYKKQKKERFKYDSNSFDPNEYKKANRRNK
ncbi:MAG: hypothetical protein Q8940_07330 [Bacteroidota bacterium]|nr:hypothetical protein [Bacteroidota bacterium]